VERETLSVETRSGEREKNRRGPAQGHDAYALLVRKSHQACSRVGDSRQPCFGKESRIAAGEERLQESRYIASLGVVVEPLDADALQRSRRRDSLQEGARRFWVFGNDVIE